jgi:putative transposase
LHGPVIDDRRANLFCFLDDHTRALVGYRWAAREDVLNPSRLQRAGSPPRGIPKAIYVDNSQRSCPASCCGHARCSGSG